MSGIFLSYRRDDSQKDTDRISDWLIRKFGKRPIFQDVDSMPAGVDFKLHVRSVISRSDIQVVVIGPQWAIIQDEHGRRRIDDPNDPVRIEIEAALAHGIPIVPLLVSGARMPTEIELPESIAALASVNAVVVRDNPNFASDIRRVIAAIGDRRLTVARRAGIAGKRFLSRVSIAGRHFLSRYGRRVQTAATVVLVLVVALSILANAQSMGLSLAPFAPPTPRATTLLSPSPSPSVSPSPNRSLSSPTSSLSKRSVQIGWSSAHPTWIWMTFNGFPRGSYTYSCNFSTPPQSESFSITETTSPQTWDGGNTCYDKQSGDHLWVIVNGMSSNTLTVP